MSTYNTPYEKLLLKIIKDEFPEFTIINPAEEKYQKPQFITQQNALDFFKTLIRDRASVLVGLPIFTGNYTDGVATEMTFALEQDIQTFTFDKNMNIYELSSLTNAIDYIQRKKLTLEETKYVRALGIM